MLNDIKKEEYLNMIRIFSRNMVLVIFHAIKEPSGILSGVKWNKNASISRIIVVSCCLIAV